MNSKLVISQLGSIVDLKPLQIQVISFPGRNGKGQQDHMLDLHRNTQEKPPHRNLLAGLCHRSNKLLEVLVPIS